MVGYGYFLELPYVDLGRGLEPIRNGEIFELTINKLKIKSCTDGQGGWNLILKFLLGPF